MKSKASPIFKTDNPIMTPVLGFSETVVTDIFLSLGLRLLDRRISYVI
jgi:hypothetical protein